MVLEEAEERWQDSLSALGSQIIADKHSHRGHLEGTVSEITRLSGMTLVSRGLGKSESLFQGGWFHSHLTAVRTDLGISLEKPEFTKNIH